MMNTKKHVFAILGVVAVVAAFLSNIKTIRESVGDFVSEINEKKSDFYGIWYLNRIENYSELDVMSMEGTAEYMRNGAYQFFGKMTIFANSEKWVFVYNVETSGNWKIENDYFVLSQLDMNSRLYDAYRTGGESYNKELIDIFRKTAPKIEDLNLARVSEEYKILSVDENSIKLGFDTNLGETKTLVLSRREKRFQRD